MNENNFKNTYLENILEVLKFSVNNEHSDFYSEKYSKARLNATKISTYEDFCKIPFLTKEEIINYPLDKRIFVETNRISKFSFSSGTTNQNKPLIIPEIKREFMAKTKSSLDDIELTGIKTLILFPPMATALVAFIDQVKRRGGIVVIGDTTNLKRTSLIAKEISIEGLVTTPTIFDFLLTELSNIDFDLEKIRFVSLGGENTTEVKLNYFKSLLPKAKFYFRYGASEAGGLIGYRCEYLQKENPNVFHPNDCLLEVIDEEDKVLEEGKVGEIVYTDLKVPKAFPIIRYKTSDIGKIVTEKCQCGEDKKLVLGGKANFDILKFNGVTLYSELIEQSLSDIKKYIKPNFSMLVSEKNVNNKVLPQLTLELTLSDQAHESARLKELIRESVSRKLILASGKNLDYFVNNNIFLPLEIRFIKNEEIPHFKNRSIISLLK